MSALIFPSDPEFLQILHSVPPPNWKQEVKGNRAYFAPDNNGILMPVNEEDLDEYEDESELTEDEEGLWLPSWIT
jgi:hypothetical protein